MVNPNAPLMLSVSGLRGTFGGSLTPEVLTRYAGTFATHVRAGLGKDGSKIHRPHIVLGFDGRKGSATVATVVRAALEMHGCRVTDLYAPVMTPTVAVVLDRLGADGALQVTASHNPQEWCGLKPIVRPARLRAGAVAASAPTKDEANALIGRYRAIEGNAASAAGAAWDRLGFSDASPSLADIHPTRVAYLMHELGTRAAVKKTRLCVGMDSVTSSGSTAAAALLAALGVKADFINDDATLRAGLFPHTPEPTRENLVGLSRAMKKSKGKLHVGFAQDPDGDRLAIVDERGSYIGEEYTLVLAALAMGELGLLKKGSVIPVNLSTSRMIEDVARRFGCHVMRTAVGEANVVEAMKANTSPLGGEGNGGVIWPAVTYIRDSLGAMGLTLALMARRKQPLSAIVKEVPSYAIIKRKVDLSPKLDPRGVIEKLAKKHAALKPDRTDGVWINFESKRAWLHVRASNTEPILRLIAEAPTSAEANAILGEAAAH